MVPAALVLAANSPSPVYTLVSNVVGDPPVGVEVTLTNSLAALNVLFCVTVGVAALVLSPSVS